MKRWKKGTFRQHLQIKIIIKVTKNNKNLGCFINPNTTPIHPSSYFDTGRKN